MKHPVGRGRPPVDTQFQKGRSGNPGGRPRRRPQHEASAFAILRDRTLTVQMKGKPEQMSVDEALQYKTYQMAIGGSQRAGRQVLKMIIARETELAKRRPDPHPHVTVKFEHLCPDNAIEALRLLGIVTDSEHGAFPAPNAGPRTVFETWAVQAAIDRRSLKHLSADDIHRIERCLQDPTALRWPRRFTHE